MDRFFQADAPEKSPVIVTWPVLGAEGLREPVRGANIDCTQLTPGVCEGAVFHIEMPGLIHNAGVFKADVRFRGSMAPKEVSLVTMLDQTDTTRLWGRPASAGDVVIFPANCEHDAHHRGVTSYAALLLTEEELQRCAQPYGSLSERAVWSVAASHPMPPLVREALRTRLRGCVAVAQLMGHDLSPRAVALLREEMVESFLSALASTEPHSVVRQTPVSHARLLRRVEDYLAERGHTAPHLLELCRDIGVSRRTLHRAFNDILGIGPKAYLRLKNLSAARTALQRTVVSGASVTQIALDHGFFELGRFAVAYRRMFGESPSQTARQPVPTAVRDPATANWRSILVEGMPAARQRELLA